LDDKPDPFKYFIFKDRDYSRVYSQDYSRVSAAAKIQQDLVRNMNRILWIVTAITGGILLVACAQPSTQQATAPQSEQPVPSTGQITGSQWTLENYNGQPVREGTTITLLFGEEGEASGSDGCNRYTTEYAVEGSSLTFQTPVVVTREVCPQSTLQQAGIYQSALSATETYAIQGEKLTLFLAGSQGSLVFAAQ
jgi:heat shock protein HslJ